MFVGITRIFHEIVTNNEFLVLIYKGIYSQLRLIGTPVNREKPLNWDYSPGTESIHRS